MTPTQAGLDAAISTAMDGATDVVRKRIDALGTREPTIVRQGANRILVQVPGPQNPEALKALIGKTAKLEFKLVDDDRRAGSRPAGRRSASQILPYAEGGGRA